MGCPAGGPPPWGGMGGIFEVGGAPDDGGPLPPEPPGYILPEAGGGIMFWL